MEIVDRRKLNQVSEPEVFDDFRPTLAGFEPMSGIVLLRELKLPEEGMIATPDAYAEPCLYCEVMARADAPVVVGQVARILKGIGTTIEFSDTEEGQRYFTVNYQDIIGVWNWK